MALSYGKKEAKSSGFQKDEKADNGMVSLELDDEDKMDTAIMVSGRSVQPDYPYGLRISLTEDELEKLKLDPKAAGIGDYIEFKARACVKSISSHQADDGECCRVELQIEEMGVMKE